MNTQRGPNGRFSDDLVREVLAQVAFDKHMEEMRVISPEEHVLRHMRKLTGDENLRAVKPDPVWYPAGVSLPNYVFEHSHSHYVAPNEWLRLYGDPTFKMVRPHAGYSDDRVDGGVRLTLKVPHVEGHVVVEVLDISNGHMSNW